MEIRELLHPRLLLKNQSTLATGDRRLCRRPRQDNQPTKQNTSPLQTISVSKLSNPGQARLQPTPPQDTQSQGATWPGPGARIKKDLPAEKFQNPVSCGGTFQNTGSRPGAASRPVPWQPGFRCHITFIFVSLDFFLFCNVLLGPPTPPEAGGRGPGLQLKSGTAWPPRVNSACKVTHFLNFREHRNGFSAMPEEDKQERS